MDKPLFVIKDLKCAYKRGDEVLRIIDLEIPRKHLVVLLGKSGSGKSTFLETLGLMNNTIKSGDVIFFPGENEMEVSYSSLWKNGQTAERARMRRDYFSFIFQNTNLMPNFTAYENACLTQMIHGVELPDAIVKVKSYMATMGLQNVPEWKTAAELSGGQKQRLAFVRAITPDFTVLFGDEPTGNLDEFNSDELMSSLKDSITKKDRSAIIVSHNIILSLQYADMIILLEKDEKQSSYGVLDQQNVFRKTTMNQWVDWHQDVVHDVYNRFLSILQPRLKNEIDNIK
jgi:putative ABC transport system ATP-binding protein